MEKKIVRPIRLAFHFWQDSSLKFLDAVILRAPTRCWPMYLQVRSWNSKTQVKFGYSRIEDLFFVEDKDVRIFVSHPRRMWLYLNGVIQRVRALADSYCLLELDIPEQSVVVDVGANVGELGIFFDRRVAYIGFEPDPAAYRSLRRNLATDQIFQQALSDHKGKGRLQIVTHTADTHLQLENSCVSADSVEVAVCTLDESLDSLNLESIFLVKIEAEGHEPEVLRGAHKTLAKTEYVALDCGPERDGRDTASACLEILYSEGFRLIDSRMLSGRVLLRRVL